MYGWGESSLLAEAGPLEDPHLELDGLGLRAEDDAAVLQAHGEGHAEGARRLEAGVVDEVDGAGAG